MGTVIMGWGQWDGDNGALMVAMGQGWHHGDGAMGTVTQGWWQWDSDGAMGTLMVAMGH